MSHHRNPHGGRRSKAEREFDRHHFDLVAFMPRCPLIHRSRPTPVIEAIGLEVLAYIQARREAIPKLLRDLMETRASEARAVLAAERLHQPPREPARARVGRTGEQTNSESCEHGRPPESHRASTETQHGWLPPFVVSQSAKPCRQSRGEKGSWPRRGQAMQGAERWPFPDSQGSPEAHRGTVEARG